MMKRIFFAFAAIILAFTPTVARNYVDKYQAGGQYLAYPVPDRGIPRLSPSPEGYIPFHIEHYGRHGSRWLLNQSDYDNAVDILQKAKRNGKLTPRGEEVLDILVVLARDAKGRTGELTPLGHRQHRGIAQRMATNFPEIFTDTTYLDAKSTIVIRCILSMANEVAELQKMFPSMPIKMDASYTTQDTLNYNSHDTVAKKLTQAARSKATAYAATLPKPNAFFDKLFTDRKFVAERLGEEKVFNALFEIAENMQSHDEYPEILDLFSEEELNNAWMGRNANWYISSGNNPMTKNRVPFNQRYLLRNFIESADTAMLSPHISANLRFGHDTMLLPLAALMELNEFGYSTSDFSSLPDHWRNYEVFPMAGNIQMVFYRPKEGNLNVDDILVKVLLNEAEVSLPVTPWEGNYYRWSDLRKYYLDKISRVP